MRPSRPLATLCVPALLLGLEATAWAGSGAMFGEASRTAALADAVTARRGELSSIYYNPGALADLEQGAFALTTHVGWLRRSFAREGEAAEEDSRTIGGYGFAVGTRLPGPDWLRAFRVGAALHLPAAHIMRLVAPARPDEPSFPLYGDRTERFSLSAAVAVELFSRIGIGAGITLSPTLVSPTAAGYDPYRSSDVTQNVVLDIGRELKFGASFMAGIRAQVVEELSLGLAYRAMSNTAAAGPNDIAAGGLRMQDQLDFYDLLEPEQIAVGAAVFPLPDWSLSIDGVLSRWSDYHTIHHRRPPDSFSDVVYLRTGLEWQSPLDWLELRAGYGYEPSPIPPQDGVTNLLGGDAHAVALGAGFDLRPLDWAPLRIDAHVRTHLLEPHQDEKSLEALPDADPEAPGQQVDNLGYPGFSAEASFWQLGMTLNLFFGSAAERAP